MRTTMPDNPENQAKMAQFVAQEIEIDRKIPHATRKSVDLLLDEARNRARVIDDKRDSFTLRLRDLGGVVRMAGDMAVMGGSEYIEAKHMEFAIKRAISIEDQIINHYQSFEKAALKDSSSQQISSTKNNCPNENVDRSYL
jgi:ATP-dependent Lon protease